MIDIQNLSHRLLRVPELHLSRGYITLVGPNGSGKTTFLEVCAGIQRPQHGIILIEGTEPRKSEIGWVSEFPDRNIVFERVYDEIASPLRFRHLDYHQIDERVKDTASKMELGQLLAAQTRKLSGGEKALVSLAAALVAQPRVLFLDETDSHLDGETAEYLLDTIREFRIPLVLHCTQNMNTAAESDRMLFMQGGLFMHDGTPEEVFSRLRETCFYPPIWRVFR